MKNLFYNTLLILLLANTASYACFPFGVGFSTQEQIDNFATENPNCTEIEGILIITGTDIFDLSGLAQINSIGGGLEIANTSLSSLTGLDFVSSFGGSLVIRNNLALSDISALQNITAIDNYVDLAGNSALANLSGLDNLTSIGAYFSLYDNNVLTDITALAKLTSIGDGLVISGHNVLINLDGLENLTNITEDFTLRDNTALEDISALNNLVAIEGDVTIENNSALKSLAGLGNVVTVGELYIIENMQLEDIELDKLTSINSYLAITENSSLEHVSFNSLSTLEGEFEIYSNDALTNISGMSNLTSINGYLYIGYNPKLAEISVFDNLTTVYGYFDIIGNTVLEDLNAFENLSAIDGYLRIRDNQTITSLAGLQNIDPNTIKVEDGGFVNYDLVITNNDNLSICEMNSICDFLDLPDRSKEIYSNNDGCDSKSEIETACSAVSTLDNDWKNSGINIYPVPASSFFNINFEGDNIEDTQISLFDINGTELKHIKKASNEASVEIEITGINSGVYIISISTGNSNVYKRLMIEN